MDIVICLFLYINVLNLANCEWWDTDSDQAKLFFDDGPARMADFPHVVSINARTGKSTAKILCGGIHLTTVNNRGVVLTAGSCINLIKTGRISSENVYVRTNSEYWNCQCGIGRSYGIYSWYLHPEYEEHVLPFIGAFSENDVGLIALDGPWKGRYNEEAGKNPIKLGPVDWKIVRPKTLGWGYTHSQQAPQEDLRVAEDLLVISGERCQKNFYNDYFPKNSYCVGSDKQPGKGPCAHDQGGPMLNVIKQVTGSKPAIPVTEYILVGIASTAPKCGDPRKPTVVVNISAYTDFLTNFSWIKETSVKSRVSSGQFIRPPPIGMDWTCRNGAQGSKVCCDPNGPVCIAYKMDGTWWWSTGTGSGGSQGGSGSGSNNWWGGSGNGPFGTWWWGSGGNNWGGWWGSPVENDKVWWENNEKVN